MPVKEYTSTGDEPVWTFREVFIVYCMGSCLGYAETAKRARCSVDFVKATLKRFSEKQVGTQLPQR
jgi:hypothetical protein